MEDFANRHVVVTGGTGALGSAVVGLLLSRGATVHVPVFHGRELEGFPYADDERVRIAENVDLTREAAVTSFYDDVPVLWAAVHAAGGFGTSGILDTPLEGLRKLVDRNLVTCFLGCREAVRRFRDGGQGGRIVNVAARPALVPEPGLAAYAATKAAVATLTLSLAEELRADEIWVNAVVPSILDTPANRAAHTDARFEDWPKVEDVAETIGFLASPRNVATRGALVPVYGRS